MWGKAMGVLAGLVQASRQPVLSKVSHPFKPWRPRLIKHMPLFNKKSDVTEMLMLNTLQRSSTSSRSPAPTLLKPGHGFATLPLRYPKGARYPGLGMGRRRGAGGEGGACGTRRPCLGKGK